MVVDALMSLIGSILTGLSSLFPTVTLPTFLSGGQGTSGSLAYYLWTYGQKAYDFQAFLPVAAVYQAVTYLIILVGALLAIKLVLKAVSLFTGGGGAG